MDDFWRAMAGDLQTMAQREAGEAIAYLPGGDVTAPIHLRAIVERESAYADADIGGLRRVVRVEVPGRAIDEGGLSLVEEGVDLVDVPLREGAAPTRCLVTSVESHTRGWWSLEVQP